MEGKEGISLSIVIPALNEEDGIRPLWDQISAMSASLPFDNFEVVFVDDGSSDSTWAAMQAVCTANQEVRAIRLRKNFGKAVALSEGIARARGEIIVTMDADLQDDPSEVPKLIAKLHEGFDLVSGWKEVRQDPISKTLPSRIFNFLTSRLTGVPIKDVNCGLKAYRTEVLHAFRIYGELHRFIPVLAHNLGFRVTELPVRHKPRQFGNSKYGFERFVRGLLDLFAVVAITRFAASPGHLFGGIGLLLGIVSAAILIYLFGIKLSGELIGNRPLFQVGMMVAIISIQFIFFGLLAEMLVHRLQPSERPRLSRELAGFEDTKSLDDAISRHQPSVNHNENSIGSKPHVE